MGLLDVLFPKRCVVCKSGGEYLCANCFAKLASASFVCVVCGKPSIDGLSHPACRRSFGIDGVCCGFAYNGVVKKLLYSFKYQPYLSDLGAYLSSLLFEQVIEQESFLSLLKNKPVFIPVPLSEKKLRKRGYNQSEILAKNLGKLFDCSVEQLLKRSRETKPQYGLNKEQRRENMQGAFTLRHSGLTRTPTKSEKDSGVVALPRMTSVILVDDVLTTGSTLLEAAKVLKRNGVKKVYGVCFAFDQ